MNPTVPKSSVPTVKNSTLNDTVGEKSQLKKLRTVTDCHQMVTTRVVSVL